MEDADQPRAKTEAEVWMESSESLKGKDEWEPNNKRRAQEF